MKTTIKDLIKDLIKETAVFEFYRKGELHYLTDKTCFRFVVPIEDCGDGEFPSEIKGITMMRWIRKQLEANAQGAWERTAEHHHIWFNPVLGKFTIEDETYDFIGEYDTYALAYTRYVQYCSWL